LALCFVGLKPRPTVNAGTVVGAILYRAFNVVFLMQAFNLTFCRVGDGNQRAASISIYTEQKLIPEAFACRHSCHYFEGRALARQV
jgi:hypothetical protein